MPEKTRFARTRHARNKWVMMTFFTPRGRKGTKLSHDKDNPLVWLRVAEQLHLAINLSVEEQARTKIFREAICQTQTSVERSKESVYNQQVLLGNVEGSICKANDRCSKHIKGSRQYSVLKELLFRKNQSWWPLWIKEKRLKLLSHFCWLIFETVSFSSFKVLVNFGINYRNIGNC